MSDVEKFLITMFCVVIAVILLNLLAMIIGDDEW